MTIRKLISISPDRAKAEADWINYSSKLYRAVAAEKAILLQELRKDYGRRQLVEIMQSAQAWEDHVITKWDREQFEP